MSVAEEQSVVPAPNVEYYEGRTDGWTWIDGQQHWWEMFIVWDGGFAGGYLPSCRRLWRWNGSSQTIRTDYVNLLPEELMAIVSRPTKGTATP